MKNFLKSHLLTMRRSADNFISEQKLTRDRIYLSQTGRSSTQVAFYHSSEEKWTHRTNTQPGSLCWQTRESFSSCSPSQQWQGSPRLLPRAANQPHSAIRSPETGTQGTDAEFQSQASQLYGSSRHNDPTYQTHWSWSRRSEPLAGTSKSRTALQSSGQGFPMAHSLTALSQALVLPSMEWNTQHGATPKEEQFITPKTQAHIG